MIRIEVSSEAGVTEMALESFLVAYENLSAEEVHNLTAMQVNDEITVAGVTVRRIL